MPFLFRSFSSTDSLSKKSKPPKTPTITLTLTPSRPTCPSGPTLTLLAPKTSLTKRALSYAPSDREWVNTVDFFLEQYGRFPPQDMRRQFPSARPEFRRTHSVEVLVGGKEGMVVLDLDGKIEMDVDVSEVKVRECEEDCEDEGDGVETEDIGTMTVGHLLSATSAHSDVDADDEVQITPRLRSLSLRGLKESYRRRRYSMGL